MKFILQLRTIFGALIILICLICFDRFKSSRKDYLVQGDYFQKPPNFEETCNLDKRCNEDCDVCCEMPYHVDTGIIQVHHYRAKTGKWNDRQRFKNLNLNKEEGGIVLYIGGNTHGRDGPPIMKSCPKCKLHIFEPVPDFNVILENTYLDMKTSKNWDVKVHKFGLGATNRIVKLPASSIEGVRTFGMGGDEESQDEEIYVELQIQAAHEVLKEVAGDSIIDLLHVNCEGCEWEMFENLIENDLLKKIRSIQFSTHFNENVPNITTRYCNILSSIKKTHTKVYGQSWGWERWDLK